MDCVVRSILRFAYRYSRFLGVINFEINVRTGHARITRRAKIIAMLANAVIICLIPFHCRSKFMQTLWQSAGLMHEYLILVVVGMRLGCIVVTLLSRWGQRHQLVRLVNTFRQLTLRRPQVISMWPSGVLRKVISVGLSESVQFIWGFLSIYNVMTWSFCTSLLVLSTMTSLMNVIISHYYFGLLNVHYQYRLLNQELRALLDETRALQWEPRSGARMTKCCCLADRLEVIAQTQMNLQMLVKRTADIFGIQGFCVSVSSYISIVGTIYYTYTTYKRGFSQNWNPAYFGLITLNVIAYLADVSISLNNIYYVHEHHAELLRLLEQYTTFAPGLDSRLEKVVSSI